MCVPCCDRCGGSAGGQGDSQCVFLFVTDVEVVPVDREALKLNPVGLAMGTAMVHSKKRRREIIESGYHR